MSEDELIQSVQRGDLAAYDDLMSNHQIGLMHTAMAILRNKDEADDAVQETFVKAFFAIKSFYFKSSFKTWLTSILINHVRSMFRKKRKFVAFDETYMSQLPDSRTHERPDGVAMQDLVDLVRIEVLNLSENQRIAFMLKVTEELSTSEIAKEMGISEGTVKSHLHRAFTWIRKKHGKRFNILFGLTGV